MKLTKFDPPTGKEYDVSVYPGYGIYQSSSGNITIKYRLVACSMDSLLNLGNVDQSSLRQIFGEEDKETSSSALSANDFLKAIAISQNPDLAVQLCK